MKFKINLRVILALSVITLFSCSVTRIQMDTLHANTETTVSSTATKFSPSQLAKLQEALIIATQSVQDPLFNQILTEQSENEVYKWGNGRLDRVDAGNRSDPVKYFLAEFKKRGLPAMSDFNARDDYNSDSVTGSTLPCSDQINFNVNNLDFASRTPVFVAGTIVHERLHSFCLKHRSNNVKKKYNLCDFAYHSGHLAIVLAQYRANGSQPVAKPNISICASLLEVLKSRNILN